MTTIAQVQDAVCRRFGLTLAELTGECQAHDVAHPRQLAYLACRKFTGKSLSNIGRAFGDRDHGSVHTGAKVAQGRVDSDPTWAGHYRCLEAMLG